MTYQVILAKEAKKSLKKVDNRYKNKIFRAIVKLRKNPHLGKPLTGEMKGKYSLRVWPYRIIYFIQKKQLIINVLEIAHRQGVYKK